MAATTIPVLPSSDFDATASFFARLGFAERGRWPDEYLIVDDGNGIELHFTFDPNVAAGGNDHTCYIRFDSADEGRALHDKWREAGLDSHHLHPPVSTDYGLLEFAVLDLDGNAIRIGGLIDGTI